MAKQTNTNTVESLFKPNLFKPNKEAYGYKLAEAVLPAVEKVVGGGVQLEDIVWEHPGQAEHGDYCTSIGLRAKSLGQSKKSKNNVLASISSRREEDRSLKVASTKNSHPGGEIGSPFELAQAIVNEWRSLGLPEFVGKVEVAPPGFINVWLHLEVLGKELQKALEGGEKYGQLDLLKGKKILLEHTSPNPQTTIMLGHLRNNFLGMAVARLWETQGATVVKDCIVNDRGVHLCRAMWGYLVFGRKRGGLTKKELVDFRNIGKVRFEEVADFLVHPRGIHSATPGVAGDNRSQVHTGNEPQAREVTAPKPWRRAGSSGVDSEEWRALLKAWQTNKSAWYLPKDLDLKPDHANLRWYVLGSRAYKESEDVQEQVRQMLVAWEAEDKAVRMLWRQIIAWSEKGYAQTYARIGSKHEKYWYESDHWQAGKEWVVKGLKKGVFKQSQGAVVTDLAKYGIPDTVVQKADGTALYITQDLELTKLKVATFPSDFYIWVIGLEQTLHFKQLFASCEALGIGRSDQLFHLSFALVNMKGGKKMATRTGDVVMADEVLDLLRERTLKIVKGSNQELRGKMTAAALDKLTEAVALGAVKYSLLKYSRETTMQFDIDESLMLEGNSGPYLQYTHARTQSVLSKSKIPTSLKLRGASKNQKSKTQIKNTKINTEEEGILRKIYQFPEVVEEAAKNFAPNLLANYLYDLAQRFNLFYNKHSIIQADSEESRDFRLALTAAVGQVLRNGLGVLGIATPERM